MTLIDELRGKREALLTTLEATVTAGVTEERDLNDAEEANVTSLRSEIEKVSARIDQLADIQLRRAADAELNTRIGSDTGITRVAEGELYREDGDHDFIKDVLSAHNGDFDARERLSANNRVEAQRAAVSADFGGYIVPQYAVNMAIVDKTEGRPFADIVTKLPLRSKTVVIPRQTANTDVEAQDGENTEFAYADLSADEIEVSAKTIGGYTDVSVQSIDFGVLSSEFVINDLVKQYNRELDRQLLVGTGNNGEIKGVFNTSGIPTVDGSGADDTGGFWGAVAAGKVSVQAAQLSAATHLVLTPGAWGWLEAQTDSEGRPLMNLGYSAPTNVVGAGQNYAGLRIVVDSNVLDGTNDATPTVQGALVTRASELILWEQGPKTLKIEEVGAHTGTVRFVIRGYAAFTAEAQPGATAVIEDIPALTLV